MRNLMLIDQAKKHLRFHAAHAHIDAALQCDRPGETPAIAVKKGQ